MSSKPVPVAPPSDETKEYPYPDKDPDLHEIQIGYQGSKWNDIAVISFVVLAAAMFGSSVLAFNIRHDIVEFFTSLRGALNDVVMKHTVQNPFLVGSLLLFGFLLVLSGAAVYVFRIRRVVYLLDFATYQPPDSYKIPHDEFMAHTRRVGWFSEESIAFQEKLLYKTGLGNETYFPPGITGMPPNMSMESARKEAELVLFGSLDELFAKTGITPKQVDILIINCSLFNPTPSLCAMVINKYKMRSDIKSFNLSGMGCSAGLISIDLAKDLLQVHRNAIAVVISTENITQNWYKGNEKSMLVTNTLFRVGGAAIMLTNRSQDRYRAKYSLHCTVRVTKAASDIAYNSVYQVEDANGNKGVRLAVGRDLLAVIGDALKTNLTILGPMVLPWSEQVKFFINLVARKMYPAKKIKPYIPNFKTAFKHFCIHAGGRAVIDGLESNLGLTPKDVEPSRATLYRYGNTSSSSIWYELNFIEKSHHVEKGDRVLQIAVGSGFKVNTAVWQALRKISS